MTAENHSFITKGRMATLIVVAILLIDQAIKIWVKTSMSLHESIHVTDWFYITFIENNGMAFGMQLGSKIVLSLFRILAIIALGYYIWLQVRRQARTGYIVCLSMVLAGAAGNLIDFYFPLIETEWPLWMPFVGGDHFVFFSPVFNFADASISVSVVLLLLFYREEISKLSFSRQTEPKEEE